MNLSNLQEIVGDAAENIARSAIQRIDIKTSYGPPITIDKPFEPGPPNPYLEKLKPEITLTFSNGQKTRMVPYGKPGPSQWPKIQAYAKWAGVATSALVGALILFVLARKK